MAVLVATQGLVWLMWQAAAGVADHHGNPGVSAIYWSNQGGFLITQKGQQAAL